ncbi:hypothetical protein INS49_011074 [Diaporthe citri]|uniref:uncharacterized protein n=1 Tax=Diaporthe citri TaxID=83186 RepID=UPI001C7E23D5|nr:uncharacterized protein INS49_011074 [Diaporthe citri]KAG6360018.1 hypothetical protein INS49_011074 [Diaporthe citri]
MAPPAGVRRDSTHLAFGAGAGAGPGADMDVSNDSPGQESVTAVDSSGDKAENAPKRIRLNLACNQCRKRKVRCDAETPKNLQNSPQHINSTTLGTRHEATSRSPHDWNSTPNFGTNSTPSNGNGGTGMNLSGDRNTSQPSDLRTQSWVSKAYDAAAQGQGDDPDHAANGQHQHPDIVINTDDNSEKVKYLGGSSLQCLTAFLDMHLRRRRLQTITPCFREGMRFVEEFDLPLRVMMPNLPDSAQDHIETFFVKVWPLIPVVDREFISAEFDRLHRKQLVHPGGLSQAMSKQDVPSIVIIFSILAIGADETAGSATDFGNSYLEAAYSLYGHLVASPYLPSVQALILLGFALRGKSKDGQCWQLTGQAVRIAHSIGLHRHISSRSRQANRGFPETFTSDQLSAATLSLEARVWWSCYAIERLMELETGRPSALTEQEIDQIHFPHPQSSEGDSVTGPLHLFVLWVSLARVMGQISEHLYHRRISDSWQLLYETGRLDQLLLEWVKTVPEGIKPGHELVHLGPDTEDSESGHQHQHIAAFLSLQYYQAQITLFRASLAFPTQKYLEEIRTRNATRRLPSYLRLLQSQNLSIAAARSMARQVLEIADHVVSSKHLFAPTQTISCCGCFGVEYFEEPRQADD